MISLGILLLISSAIAVPSRNFEGRIVGGHNVDLADFPYQVSLGYYGSHICGGAILSEDWAITAGHCIGDAWAYELLFRAESGVRNRAGSIHMVKDIKVHPQYNDTNMDYDFALLSVKVPFNLSSPLSKPIKLANKGLKPEEMTTITGWGTHWDGGEASNLLEAVDLPIIDHQLCRDRYNIYAPELPNMITDRMLCAGFQQGGKDACQGDSGGPMVNKETKELQGLVSWAFGCGYPEVPGVYSDVTLPEIKKWIKDTTGILV